MALHRGIQSAIFYYLSCAPCTGYNYRKKRRRQATMDRAEKEALEEEQPGLYRHPSPFATNPNWQTEIALGPVHGPAGRKKKGDKAGTENTWALQTTGSKNSAEVGSNPPSASDSGGYRTGAGSQNDSKINLRRAQREDEELWGSNVPESIYSKQQNRFDGGASIISRPPTAKTTRTERSTTSYHSKVNPPINDLHPAIIARMDSRDDVAWMLQPPPPVRFMQGKETSNRDRSNSGGSSKNGSRKGADEKLSRQVSQRLLNEKIQRGNMLEEPVRPKDHLRRISSDLTGGEPRIRTASRLIDSSDEDDESRPTRRKRNAKAQMSEDSVNSSSTVIRRATDQRTASVAGRSGRAAKQFLSRVTSDSPSPRTQSPNQQPDRFANVSGQRTVTRPPLLDRDSNSSQIVHPSKSILRLATLERPSAEIKAAQQNGIRDTTNARNPSWQSWDGEWELRFPDWAADRVQRDLSHRWSMDF